MTTIDRIRVPWSGGRGGPGVSTFYALSGATALAPLRAFFEANKQLIPTGIQCTFVAGGDTLVAETGVLSGTWTGTGEPSVITTGNSLTYSAAAGFAINWRTNAVLFGHRVVGRTFIVPAVRDAFDDGSINPGVQTGTAATAATMLAAVPGNFVVWVRPVTAAPSWTDVHGRVHPARAAHAGAFAPIVVGEIPDLAVVLRSRRD